MSTLKLSKQYHLKQTIFEFGEVFTTDGNVLLCTVCGVKVVAEKRFTIQHIKCDKHIRALEKAAKMKSSQQLLTQTAATNHSKSSEFFKDLCDVMVSVNIPLWKLTQN